jgi:hypothetical protein
MEGQVRRHRTASRKPAKAQQTAKRDNAPTAARSSSTLADLQEKVSALTRELK